MRDHNFVAFEYAERRAGAAVGHDARVARLSRCRRAVLRRQGHDRDVGEPLAALPRRGQETFEKSPRNITIDSVAEFVSRIAEGRPENTGVRGAESTFTAILGRMAMDLRAAKSPGTK